MIRAASHNYLPPRAPFFEAFFPAAPPFFAAPFFEPTLAAPFFAPPEAPDFPPEDFDAPALPGAWDFEALPAAFFEALLAVFFADFDAAFFDDFPAAFEVCPAAFFDGFAAAFFEAFAPPLPAPFFDAPPPDCFALRRSTISCARCSTSRMRAADRKSTRLNSSHIPLS